MPSLDTYLLCATPRTGSTMLCALLASTEIAGKPESWFREPDLLSRAETWGIPIDPDGTFRFQDFVQAAVRAGSTDNGVFGARIMWGTMERVVEKLRDSDHDSSVTDREVLERALGHTRFIYLRREDVVAQAVSWARAEQTDIWIKTEETDERGSDKTSTVREVRFDAGVIDGYVEMIERHKAAWTDWFERQPVTPLSLRYEDLLADQAGTAHSILRWLGLDPARGRDPVATSYRQGDVLNQEWIEQYRAVRSHL